MFASSYLFYSWVKEICKSWHKNKHKLCERKTHTYDKGNGEANSHTQTHTQLGLSLGDRLFSMLIVDQINELEFVGCEDD